MNNRRTKKTIYRDRLRAYLDSKNISPASLSRQMGFSPQYITDVLKGTPMSESAYILLSTLHPDWNKQTASQNPVIIEYTDKQVEEVNKVIIAKAKVNNPTYPEFDPDWPLQLAIAWLENFPKERGEK